MPEEKGKRETPMNTADTAAPTRADAVCPVREAASAGNLAAGDEAKSVRMRLRGIGKKILRHFYRHSVVFGILLIWQALSSLGIVPSFFLPSPLEVLRAFCDDVPLLMQHSVYTLAEAFWGSAAAVFLAFILSIFMDHSPVLRELLYAPLVVTQTIPTVAIAPLLILWLGYYMMPKIVLVILTVFFPILIALLDGYRSVDPDSIKLLNSMGAKEWQIYYHVKFPASLSHFFAGLKVSLSYALVSAVVAEWLGGYHGLGVYMTRVRKAYAIDKMFAVIFFISALSLLLMYLVERLRRRCLRYEHASSKRPRRKREAARSRL